MSAFDIAALVLARRNVDRSKQDADTYHGAKQMADLVLGWIDAGESIEGLAVLVRAKRADLEEKFKRSHEAVIAASGVLVGATRGQECQARQERAAKRARMRSSAWMGGI